jgi:hypothetical protein
MSLTPLFHVFFGNTIRDARVVEWNSQYRKYYTLRIIYPFYDPADHNHMRKDR